MKKAIIGVVGLVGIYLGIRLVLQVDANMTFFSVIGRLMLGILIGGAGVMAAVQVEIFFKTFIAIAYVGAVVEGLIYITIVAGLVLAGALAVGFQAGWLQGLLMLACELGLVWGVFFRPVPTRRYS